MGRILWLGYLKAAGCFNIPGRGGEMNVTGGDCYLFIGNGYVYSAIAPVPDTAGGGEADVYIAGSPIVAEALGCIDSCRRQGVAEEFYFGVPFGPICFEEPGAAIRAAGDVGKVQVCDTREVAFIFCHGAGQDRGADEHRVRRCGIDTSSFCDDVHVIPARIGR